MDDSKLKFVVPFGQEDNPNFYLDDHQSSPDDDKPIEVPDSPRAKLEFSIGDLVTSIKKGEEDKPYEHWKPKQPIDSRILTLFDNPLLDQYYDFVKAYWKIETGSDHISECFEYFDREVAAKAFVELGSFDIENPALFFAALDSICRKSDQLYHGGTHYSIRSFMKSIHHISDPHDKKWWETNQDELYPIVNQIFHLLVKDEYFSVSNIQIY